MVARFIERGKKQPKKRKNDKKKTKRKVKAKAKATMPGECIFIVFPTLLC